MATELSGEVIDLETYQPEGQVIDLADEETKSAWSKSFDVVSSFFADPVLREGPLPEGTTFELDPKMKNQGYYVLPDGRKFLNQDDMPPDIRQRVDHHARAEMEATLLWGVQPFTTVAKGAMSQTSSLLGKVWKKFNKGEEPKVKILSEPPPLPELPHLPPMQIELPFSQNIKFKNKTRVETRSDITGGLPFKTKTTKEKVPYQEVTYEDLLPAIEKSQKTLFSNSPEQAKMVEYLDHIDEAVKQGLLGASKANLTKKGILDYYRARGVEHPILDSAKAEFSATLEKDSILGANPLSHAPKDELLGEMTTKGTVKTSIKAALRYVSSISGAYKTMGRNGEELSRRIYAVYENSRRRVGNFIVGDKAKGEKTFRDFYQSFSKKENEQFVEHLIQLQTNPLLKAPSVKISNAVNAFFKPVFELSHEARNMGLKVSGYDTKSGKFFQKEMGEPKFFFPQQIVEWQKLRTNRFYSYLVKTGAAENMEHARMVVQRWISQFSDRKFAGMENARLFHVDSFKTAKEFGYETDAYNLWTNFLTGSTKRLEEVKQYGHKDAQAAQLIQGIIDEGYDPALARKMFDNLVEPDFTTRWTATQAKRFMSFNSATLLGWAQILQLGQLSNTMVKYGVTPTAKAMFESIRHPQQGREFAEAAGAILEHTLREHHELLGRTGSITSKILKYEGFTPLDRWVRIVSTGAAKHYINKTLARLEKAPTSSSAKTYRRMLGELGIDADKALKSGVTQDQYLTAGFRVSDSTQFTTHRSKLPFFYHSPEVKALLQYKSFMFFQTKFIKETVFGEMKKGNLKPLALFLTVYPAMGEIVGDIRAGGQNAIIAAFGGDVRRVRPDSFLARYIDDMAMVGGVGILSDLLYYLRQGQLQKWLTGPTVGLFSDLGKAGFDLMRKGDWDSLGKMIVGRIPVVGQPTSKVLFPPPTGESKIYRRI